MSEDRQLPEIIDAHRLGLPTGPQHDPAAVQNALITARKHAIVLAPSTPIEFLPPDHVVQLMVVTFSTSGIQRRTPHAKIGDRPNDDYNLAARNSSNGLWYSTDNGKLAHSRVALDQLATACGITWVHGECGRTDNRRNPYLWAYRMTCEYKGLTGITRRVSREKELDLRGSGNNLSPAARKAGNGLARAREHGAAACESKAANRAIRAALGLGSYTMEEAALPFVFPVLRWVPDTSNPLIAAMVAAKELGMTEELFGSPAFQRHAGIEADPPRQIVTDEGAPTGD